MHWHVKKNPLPRELLVPMPPTDPTTFVTDYEVLRASFLSSRATPATRLGIQRLIAEGLQAWLKSQPLARPCKAQREASPCLPPITAEAPNSEALIQLIACMTQTLVFAEEIA